MRWLIMNFSQDLDQNDLKIVKMQWGHCEKFTVSVMEGIYPTRETPLAFCSGNARQQIGYFIRFSENIYRRTVE